MTIFPAVDIRKGRAVRLRQGRKEDITIFGDNPLEIALDWQAQGAKWLHLVDLDAAFGEKPNIEIIGKIARTLAIPVQLGGGVRNMEAARRYIDAGVQRLIIGTLALEDPEAFGAMCEAFPGRIGVSLDAEKGRLKSRGWLADANLQLREIVPDLEKRGASFIIYTDIERDGMQAGLNLEAVRELLDFSQVPVIIAGGVANMDDIRAVCSLNAGARLQGVISGRALYEKTLNLAEALSWLARS